MDGFFGLDRTHAPSKDLELLTTAYSQPELLIIQSILSDDNIPFLTKERGTGNSMKIIAGYSVFGTDIYVLREQLELASELLSAPTDADEEESDAKEEIE